METVIEQDVRMEVLENPVDLAAIDIEHSTELVGDRALAIEMLQLLQEKLPKEIAGITQCYEAQDYPALANAAHKLVGGIAYCGVPALRTSARALEYAAESGDIAEIEECYRQLHAQLKRFDDALAVI